MLARLSSALALPLLGAFLITLSACMPIQAPAAGIELPAMAGAELAGDSEGRLLVEGSDGNLYTMDSDGTDVVALTTDASPTLQYLQPSWSPNADQIAWTAVAAEGETARSSLVIASVRDNARQRLPVPFPPFYISWNPDGSRLAYLSAWSASGRPSMALRLVDLGDQSVVTLGEGQPFYFSWAPDGDALLTHVGNERLEIQGIDGSQQALTRTGASFPTPQWFPSGDSLLYAVSGNNIQRLIVAEADGREIAEITDFDGSISFTLSPDETQIAYAVTPVSAGTSAFGPLYVVDVETGATRQLSEMPVIGFFWSPDSEKLAFLAVERDAEDFRFRWHVWDGSTARRYAAVLPTRTFLERYLAFFDQYAQSMTIWSPDSSAFAYAAIGLVEAGESNGSAAQPVGIWVQELAADSPRYVGPGAFAAWSPK